MYGNLICISPNGKFEDIIWATVAERDETLLNKSQLIMVQLCKENDLKVSDIYDRLDVCGGQVCHCLSKIKSFEMFVRFCNNLVAV